jgi:hypothetical protein
MFWSTLGDLMPLAFAALISPMPIVAAIALLLGPKGRGNGVAFAAAYLIGTFGVTIAFSFGTNGATSTSSEAGRILHIVLGFALAALFFWLAWRSWQHRPRKGVPAPTPTWLAAVDSFGVLKSAGLGLLLGVVNVKNLPIMIAAGASIGTATLGWPLMILAAAIFAALGGLGILVPVVVGGSGSSRVRAFLDATKSALIAHNSIIMIVLFVILAAVQLGKAFSAI